MNNHFLYTLTTLFLLQAIIIIAQPLRKPDKLDKKKGFHWTTLTIIVCQTLMIITCLLDTFLNPKTTNYLNLIGLALVLISLILTYASLNDLGESYSLKIKVKKGQKLVTTGTYKYIRNPMDLASLLFMAGLPLFSSSLISISFLFPFIPIMIAKINFEEKLLSKQLKGYKEYMKKTKRLIPYIY